MQITSWILHTLSSSLEESKQASPHRQLPPLSLEAVSIAGLCARPGLCIWKGIGDRGEGPTFSVQE